MTMTESLIGELNEEAETTRRVLERVPEDRLSWRPHPMLNHWYHHRGQLVVYLRLLDVPVPAVYGDSADEAPAFARK